MSRYYCPFCASRYQIYKTRTDGVLICGQCGDPLMKKPLIKKKQIVAFIAASAFLAPLFIMIAFVLNEFTEENKLRKSESLGLLIK